MSNWSLLKFVSQMCHFYVTNKLCCALCPDSSILLKHDLPSCKKAFEGFLLHWYHPEAKSLEETCRPPPSVHTLPTLSLNESSFVEPLFPKDSKSSLHCSPMENVIPQWWIVNIVFLFSEAQAPRTRTCRSRRWALPRLSSNQITQISLCVHSVCPFI